MEKKYRKIAEQVEQLLENSLNEECDFALVINLEDRSVFISNIMDQKFRDFMKQFHREIDVYH